MANYSADAHAAQMKLLRQLLLSSSCKFSELVKATGLTSDHANFHIKQLVEAGLVKHVLKTHGQYELTQHGKDYANHMDTDEFVMEKQPKLSVVLDIVNVDGRHLQQERLKQPYYGYWGRPTGKIRAGETMIEAAARELKEETGLEADLTVLGFYHKLDYDVDGNFLEDKYFCVVRGVNPRGEMLLESDGQRNEWLTNEEFLAKEKNFGGIEELQSDIDAGRPFVFEKKFVYPYEDY
ncbi:MAG TPA: NUDIX domain-containing protein [Candidatus Saccharibacteria bacterium]|nr:NUDIX domain-containing protein [Candidatus Saccharibacteria bacterium]